VQVMLIDACFRSTCVQAW